MSVNGFGDGMMRLLWCMLICMLLVGCYDGDRRNPFDPELTPAVELLDVRMDEGEGTATLVWTGYDGEMAFEAYRVERRVAERVSVDTVKVISSVSDTSWVDDTIAPETEYVYRVIVRNADGFERESNEYRSGSFRVYPVRLLDVEVDGERGEADLAWTRFDGPDFESYEVVRWVAGMAERETRTVISSVSDTMFSDGDLLPDTEYVYGIATKTSGKEIFSNEIARNEYRLPGIQLLSVGVDDRKGEAHIVWTRYDGPGFEWYRVRRYDNKLLAWEDRKDILSVDDTTFVDGDLLPEVIYKYRVVLRAFGEDFETGEEWVSHQLPSVNLEPVDFDSLTATASLSWSRYDGPRFKAYEVWKSAEKLRDAIIFRSENIGETSCVDIGLEGNTVYFYKVEVVDTTGARSESNEQKGGFHLFVEEYPLGFVPYGMVIDKDNTVSVSRRIKADDGSGTPFIVQYDPSFQGRSMVQLGGTVPRWGRFKLTVGRKGNVYAGYELAEGGVRVCKMSPVAFSSGGFGTYVWSEDIEIEGAELVGIGMIGENEVVVLGSNGQGVILDSDGQRASETVSMYGGFEISAMEIWEHLVGFILPTIGKVWVAEMAKIGGKIYIMNWSSMQRIGEGVALSHFWENRG